MKEYSQKEQNLIGVLYFLGCDFFSSQTYVNTQKNRWERSENFLLPQPLQKLLKWGIQLHFGWAHAHPGNRLSNLKILASYIIPFLTGLFLLRETTFY